MYQLVIFITILTLISSTLLIINFLISKKSLINREKISPFECGFDPISGNHMPFSVQFFMISLIFLIFDIEITMLIPLISLMKYFSLPMIMSSLMFMLILIYGLYIEYSEKSIDWKI